MNAIQMGVLIRKRRQEKQLTQLELARILNISDKTVSKWERGMGYPDITIVPVLAAALEVNASELLTGEQIDTTNNGGNMKKIKFYVCETCKNVVTSTNEIVLSCCGQKLTALKKIKDVDSSHQANVELVEDDLFITFNHPMEKTHFISFVAYVTMDRLYLIKLYPEQNPEVRFPKRGRGSLYMYCTEEGLIEIQQKNDGCRIW
ncbi:MAG: helix-turn-helix domain-containing protein [Cellulosilyticaceae bacterium]